MDDAWWMQCYGDRDRLLASAPDADVKRLIQINYGPWDQLHDDSPIIANAGPKPAGANFYPPDMTVAEFEAAATIQPRLKDMYTMVRRDKAGQLTALPYHQFFRKQVEFAADRLRQAAELAKDVPQKKYLSLRADGLITDNFRPSDFAWMDMRENTVDLLIGPMETSADRLLWIKAAYAASVLIKDLAWSKKFAHYLQLLNRFQENLPVPPEYLQEPPGMESDLQVYDAVYCAGYDNASLPLGINWPNDEEVRNTKGTRSLQIKNLMQAKFGNLLAPIASLLISTDQRDLISFEAFFTFILFHEIGHGLGLKSTISARGLVTEALGEYNYVIEELKADLLSLLTIGNLHRWGEISSNLFQSVFITSLADIFRRNGHSRQVTVRLNYFKETGAYSRDSATGVYRVHFDQAQAATRTLAEKLLRFQGDGDRDGVRAFLDRYGQPDAEMLQDLERLESAGLPLEIYLEQD